MGTAYHMVDVVGRHALAIDKARWLLDNLGRFASHDAIDAEAVRSAVFVGLMEDDVLDWAFAEWAAPLVIRWLVDVAEGRPVAMLSEYRYEDDVPPWLVSVDFRGTSFRKWPATVAPGWTLHDMYPPTQTVGALEWK